MSGAGSCSCATASRRGTPRAGGKGRPTRRSRSSGIAQARGGRGGRRARADCGVLGSDLDRARDTAELVVPAGIALESRRRVCASGTQASWTGLTRPEIEERYPGWLAARRSPPASRATTCSLTRALPALASSCRRRRSRARRDPRRRDPHASSVTCEVRSDRCRTSAADGSTPTAMASPSVIATCSSIPTRSRCPGQI